MSTTKGKNILIVDDDKDFTSLYETFLKYDGYKVDVFTDPVDALSSFKKYTYDLVLLDLKMPQMNGIELSHKIKEIDSNVIICFTTADRTYIKELRKGILDIDKIVLYKPVLLKDLKNKIDWLLSHQEIINQ